MESEDQRRREELAWEFKRDFFHHSDRAAIDLGIAGLNAITLLNGGAIVALLAFIGQVWNDGKGADIVKALIHAGIPFGWGVAAGGTCFFMAYFYQSSVTRIAGLELEALGNPSPEKIVRKRAERSSIIWKALMVLSAVAAVFLFLWGAVRVSEAFLIFSNARLAHQSASEDDPGKVLNSR